MNGTRKGGFKVTLGAHDIRRISVAAYCSPKTVRRFLQGCDLMSTTHARIAAAMRELGFEEPPAVREADVA